MRSEYEKKNINSQVLRKKQAQQSHHVSNKLPGGENYNMLKKPFEARKVKIEKYCLMAGNPAPNL